MADERGRKLADAMFGPAFGFFPQMQPKRSKQDPEAAKNVPIDLARGIAAGALGAPGDIESLIRLIPGLGGETFLPTSEDVLKRIPGGSDTPASRAAAGLGTLAGGFYTGPGSGIRAVTSVAKALPKAAKDFAQAAGKNVSPLTVYHGSPHKFEKFDASKIGTGEGAQAYGHGLYFAESPRVAKNYQQSLSDFDMLVDGKPFDNANPAHRAALELKQRGGDAARDEVISAYKRQIADLRSRKQKWASDLADAKEEEIPFLKSGKLPTYSEATKGHLYKVDLPDEAIAKMLDWDKPLSQQTKEVRETVLNAFPATYVNGQLIDPAKSQLTGRALLDQLDVIANKRNPPGLRQAELALREAGIPGIRYLDQDSRGAGQGTSNFVVFPGEEGRLTILERNPKGMAHGGPVHFSDNPDTMRLELAGGGAAKLAKLLRAPAKTQQEIETIAERVAPQVTGEYVRESAKSAKTVAGKTQKQFEREKNLPVDIRATGAERTVKPVDIEKLKGEVMIGIAGDPTVTSKTLHGVGDVRLESPAPQHGGPLYGLYHNQDQFWASGLGPARGVQNLAKRASQQYDAPVVGQYVMMGPESINYALHFADANLQAIDLSKMSKAQIEGFNNLIRKGSQESGPRPNFPGIEDKGDAYLQFAFDPELRKHFNALMQRPKVVELFNLPSGQDIRFAITEPALRDLEIGVTGFSMGRMRPEVSAKELKLSEHPTYSHDIPGEFMGQTRYPIPYELSFPDTLKAIRENPRQAPQEFGSLKMVGPRQVVDQQLIDEIKAYEEQMKALTGKKKGGKVSFTDNPDVMRLALNK